MVGYSAQAHAAIQKVKRTHTIRLLVILLAYLLVQAGGGAAMVLCIGADGHLGLKTESGGPCDELIDTASRRAAEPSTREALALNIDNCGPCTDLPFSPPTSHQQPAPRKSSSSAGKILYLSTSPCDAPILAGVKGHGPSRTPCLAVNPTLLSLRTIVILS